MLPRLRRSLCIAPHLTEYMKTLTWRPVLEVRENTAVMDYSTLFDKELGMVPIVRFRQSVYIGRRVTKWISDFYYDGIKHRSFESAILAFSEDYPEIFEAFLPKKRKRRKKELELV